MRLRLHGDVAMVETMHTGGCLCGGVRYEIRGKLRGVVACHCAQCRRTSGHHSAMSSAPNDRLSLTCAATLVWYRSSASAERGFCSVCGSNLFWRPDGENRTSITAGTLDTPTQIAMARHIFTAEKSDYYEIEDGLPKMAGWD
jgi:hypothetical protein